MTTVVPAPAAPGGTAPAPSKKRGRGGSTLWRYLVIRFLLIFPTVFILVTLVFVLMRITGDPITIALGGKLPPDQLASASIMPATTGRSSCSTSSTSATSSP